MISLKNIRSFGVVVRRYISMKFPEPSSFNGTQNAKELESFLWDMDQYLKVVKILENEQVQWWGCTYPGMASFGGGAAKPMMLKSDGGLSIHGISWRRTWGSSFFLVTKVGLQELPWRSSSKWALFESSWRSSHHCCSTSPVCPRKIICITSPLDWYLDANWAVMVRSKRLAGRHCVGESVGKLSGCLYLRHEEGKSQSKERFDGRKYFFYEPHVGKAREDGKTQEVSVKSKWESLTRPLGCFFCDNLHWERECLKRMN